MEMAMEIRRSLIDQALESLMTGRRKTRTRTVKLPAPAEDCEFPEEAEQEFPEDEIQEFPEDEG